MLIINKVTSDVLHKNSMIMNPRARKIRGSHQKINKLNTLGPKIFT